jgi:acetyl-CoA C-acetyltransferase
MSHSVFILGGHQTDFARNAARENIGLAELTRETIEGALAACGLEVNAIESIHVGNAFGELFAGQAHLGAMPATVVPALAGIPASRHEAACASGSIAILSAMSEIEAGRYDCILVLGVEQQRNVPGELAAKHLGAAAWVGHEGKDARYMWPHLFSQVADEVDRRYGLKQAHLAKIAEKNFSNAKRNPNAQSRNWTLTQKNFAEDDEANPRIEGRLRRHDCGQMSDGSACVILASEKFATEFAKTHGTKVDALPRISGWGHRTAELGLASKMKRSESDPYLFPHVRQAIVDAYRRAGISGPQDLSGIETHDCFTITEYVAIDHFGITPPGKSFQAIEDGRLEITGKLPVNASGGLIGLGHPVGATGVRMLVDAAKQVSGNAGEMQIGGAKKIGTLNIGGAVGTVVSFVVETCGDLKS